jgi:hypothetical protein
MTYLPSSLVAKSAVAAANGLPRIQTALTAAKMLVARVITFILLHWQYVWTDHGQPIYITAVQDADQVIFWLG